jgi:hypothetical protein
MNSAKEHGELTVAALPLQTGRLKCLHFAQLKCGVLKFFLSIQRPQILGQKTFLFFMCTFAVAKKKDYS